MRKMKNGWNRTGLIGIVLCLTLLCAAAFAEETVRTSEAKWVSVEAGGLSNDAAAAGYIQRVMAGKPTGSSGLTGRGTLAGDMLPDTERNLYDALKEQISAVAAGDRESTELLVPYSEIFGEKDSYTLAELGYEEVDDSVSEAFWGHYQVDVPQVVRALLADCPYELYWFDNTQSGGYWYDEQGTDLKLTDDGASVTFQDGYANAYEIISFVVAEEYRPENAGNAFTADTTYGQSAQQAAQNAQTIVANNSGLSDFEKLTAYKNWICSNVDYNTAAAENEDTPYGNPWQMIWVFDNNDETDVVCEGYSKAFQYLCDNTAFSGNVTSVIAMGWMSGGTGAGLHMWNLVRTEADGDWYMVDVTNSDADSVGAQGGLFMDGYDDTETTGEGDTWYIYDTAGGSRISYLFDEELDGLYGEGYPELAPGEEYVPESQSAIEVKAPAHIGTEEDLIIQVSNTAGVGYLQAELENPGMLDEYWSAGNNIILTTDTEDVPEAGADEWADGLSFTAEEITAAYQDYQIESDLILLRVEAYESAGGEPVLRRVFLIERTDEYSADGKPVLKLNGSSDSQTAVPCQYVYPEVILPEGTTGYRILRNGNLYYSTKNLRDNVPPSTAQQGAMETWYVQVTSSEIDAEDDNWESSVAWGAISSPVVLTVSRGKTPPEIAFTWNVGEDGKIPENQVLEIQITNVPETRGRKIYNAMIGILDENGVETELLPWDYVWDEAGQKFWFWTGSGEDSRSLGVGKYRISITREIEGYAHTNPVSKNFEIVADESQTGEGLWVQETEIRIGETLRFIAADPDAERIEVIIRQTTDEGNRVLDTQSTGDSLFHSTYTFEEAGTFTVYARGYGENDETGWLIGTCDVAVTASGSLEPATVTGLEESYRYGDQLAISIEPVEGAERYVYSLCRELHGDETEWAREERNAAQPNATEFSWQFDEFGPYNLYIYAYARRMEGSRAEVSFEVDPLGTLPDPVIHADSVLISGEDMEFSIDHLDEDGVCWEVSLQSQDPWGVIHTWAWNDETITDFTVKSDWVTMGERYILVCNTWKAGYEEVRGEFHFRVGMARDENLTLYVSSGDTRNETTEMNLQAQQECYIRVECEESPTMIRIFVPHHGDWQYFDQESLETRNGIVTAFYWQAVAYDSGEYSVYAQAYYGEEVPEDYNEIEWAGESNTVALHVTCADRAIPGTVTLENDTVAQGETLKVAVGEGQHVREYNVNVLAENESGGGFHNASDNMSTRTLRTPGTVEIDTGNLEPGQYWLDVYCSAMQNYDSSDTMVSFTVTENPEFGGNNFFFDASMTEGVSQDDAWLSMYYPGADYYMVYTTWGGNDEERLETVWSEPGKPAENNITFESDLRSARAEAWMETQETDNEGNPVGDPVPTKIADSRVIEFTVTAEPYAISIALDDALDPDTDNTISVTGLNQADLDWSVNVYHVTNGHYDDVPLLRWEKIWGDRLADLVIPAGTLQDGEKYAVTANAVRYGSDSVRASKNIWGGEAPEPPQAVTITGRDTYAIGEDVQVEYTFDERCDSFSIEIYRRENGERTGQIHGEYSPYADEIPEGNTFDEDMFEPGEYVIVVDQHIDGFNNTETEKVITITGTRPDAPDLIMEKTTGKVGDVLIGRVSTEGASQVQYCWNVLGGAEKTYEATGDETLILIDCDRETDENNTGIRVRAKFDGVWSMWSVVYELTVLPGDSPEAPDEEAWQQSLTIPDSLVPGQDAAVTHTAVEDAVNYVVYLYERNNDRYMFSWDSEEPGTVSIPWVFFADGGDYVIMMGVGAEGTGEDWLWCEKGYSRVAAYTANRPLTAELDKDTYAYGEPMRVTVSAENAERLAVMPVNSWFDPFEVPDYGDGFVMNWDGAGEYSVRFAALAGGQWTDWSEPVDFTVNEPLGTLDAVTGLELPETVYYGQAAVITWDPVDDATGYTLYARTPEMSMEFDTVETSCTLPADLMKTEWVELYVVATAPGYMSNNWNVPRYILDVPEEAPACPEVTVESDRVLIQDYARFSIADPDIEGIKYKAFENGWETTMYGWSTSLTDQSISWLMYINRVGDNSFWFSVMKNGVWSSWSREIVITGYSLGTLETPTLTLPEEGSLPAGKPLTVQVGAVANAEYYNVHYRNKDNSGWDHDVRSETPGEIQVCGFGLDAGEYDVWVEVSAAHYEGSASEPATLTVTGERPAAPVPQQTSLTGKTGDLFLVPVSASGADTVTVCERWANAPGDCYLVENGTALVPVTVNRWDETWEVRACTDGCWSAPADDRISVEVQPDSTETGTIIVTVADSFLQGQDVPVTFTLIPDAQVYKYNVTYYDTSEDEEEPTPVTIVYETPEGVRIADGFGSVTIPAYFFRYIGNYSVTVNAYAGDIWESYLGEGTGRLEVVENQNQTAAPTATMSGNSYPLYGTVTAQVTTGGAERLVAFLLQEYNGTEFVSFLAETIELTGSENTYTYSWYADQPGDFSLVFAAYRNGVLSPESDKLPFTVRNPETRLGKPMLNAPEKVTKGNAIPVSWTGAEGAGWYSLGIDDANGEEVWSSGNIDGSVTSLQIPGNGIGVSGPMTLWIEAGGVGMNKSWAERTLIVEDPALKPTVTLVSRTVNTMTLRVSGITGNRLLVALDGKEAGYVAAPGTGSTQTVTVPIRTDTKYIQLANRGTDRFNWSVLSDEVYVLYNETLTLPTGLTEIESEAFAGLGKPVTIVVPASVTTIADDAFEGSEVVLLVTAGSDAETWAKNNNVPWVAQN